MKRPQPSYKTGLLPKIAATGLALAACDLNVYGRGITQQVDSTTTSQGEGMEERGRGVYHEPEAHKLNTHQHTVTIGLNDDFSAKDDCFFSVQQGSEIQRPITTNTRGVLSDLFSGTPNDHTFEFDHDSSLPDVTIQVECDDGSGEVKSNVTWSFQ